MAKNPPIKTKTKPTTNHFRNFLPSNATSKATPARGIIAAVKAATTGVVKYIVVIIKIEPIPNPIPPTHNPFIQPAPLSGEYPSLSNHISSKRRKAEIFLNTITDKIPQSFNNKSEAGNVKAKSATATKQVILERIRSRPVKL